MKLPVLKLRTQVRLVALGCLLLGICGTFLVASYYEGRLYDSALERRARVMLDALHASAVEPLLNYDIVALDNLVEAIRRDKSETNQDLEYALILDADGHVLAHSHGYHLYGSVPTDDASRRALAAEDVLVQRLGNVLEVSRPVLLGGKRWGTVRVALNLGQFRHQVNLARLRTLAIVVLLALALALIASASLRPLFFRPLQQVIEAATAIGRRQFEHRIVHQRSDELGELYDAMNQMAVQLEEKEKLSATFGQYVSRQVRDAILTGKVSTGGAKLRAAFLFADLRGFTRRCESLPPEQVLALLNRFFTRMTAAIEAAGGNVDKFIGDSVMAVFGAPLPSADAELQAVRAGESMRGELAELNAELARDGLEPVRMGIGIHAGECVAGAIGAPTRMQYSVVGDAVNVAARLEELTKVHGTDVILSDAVVTACGDRIRVRELGAVDIRGREKGARIFSLEGLTPARARAASS